MTMEIEATTTEITVGPTTGIDAHAEGFGTRLQTGRPHSISLFGASSTAERQGTARGLDVLLGVGIGAAVMYYLDPDGGARRRGAARDTIVRVVTTAPDAFESTAHDVGDWARRTMAHAEVAGSSDRLLHDDAREWTPAGRLVAGTIGGVLTLLAARRRDALGAAVGLVGSALLARGVSKTLRREPSGRSETAGEPRDLGAALERPGYFKEV
jgi:hypothetical protein